MSLTDEERETMAQLIPAGELGVMLEEARRILESKPREYNYRNEHYKGGPRNIDPERLDEAGIELMAARLVYEEMADRAIEATLILYEKMDELVGEGIPVGFVAENSGFRHRQSVYRIINTQLPNLRESMSSARQMRTTFAKGE